MILRIKPLSVNQAWQGKRFKTPKYKNWRTEICYLLPELDVPNVKLSLYIKFGFSSKASDIDNPLKTFIDALQFKYKFDDKMIYKLEVHKEIVKKGQEFISFNIQEL